MIEGSTTLQGSSIIELAERFPHTFTIQYPPSRDFFRAHFRAAPPDDDYSHCGARVRRDKLGSSRLDAICMTTPP